jgi:hypothetical protein
MQIKLNTLLTALSESENQLTAKEAKELLESKDITKSMKMTSVIKFLCLGNFKEAYEHANNKDVEALKKVIPNLKLKN